MDGEEKSTVKILSPAFHKFR